MSNGFWAIAYDTAEMRTIQACTIEKLCYIGNSNIDVGESDYMTVENKFGSHLLYAYIPTLNNTFGEATSCGIIFTLSADL